MKIVVFSPKGGVGKTSISNSLFIDLKLDYITNDTSIITKLHDNATLITGELPSFDKTLYDLGGFNTPFISKALREADRVIIPTINDYNSILKTLEVIDFVGDKKVTVIANMVDSQTDIEEITSPIKNRHPKIKIFPLKRSKAFKRALESGNSLTFIYEETGLSKHNYKSIYAQYENIIKEMKKWRKRRT